MRADAVANRARLLNAAEVVFSREGAHAPLQRIAEEAGVGRGTLYRHFEDRTALVIALFAHRIDHLIELVADNPDAPDAAETILRSTLQIQRTTPGLTQLVTATDNKFAAELAVHSSKLEEFLARPVAAGIAAGRIFADITPRDFMLGWAMFEGVTSTYMEYNYEAQVERARMLILRSILVSP